MVCHGDACAPNALLTCAQPAPACASCLSLEFLLALPGCGETLLSHGSALGGQATELGDHWKPRQRGKATSRNVTSESVVQRYEAAFRRNPRGR